MDAYIPKFPRFMQTKYDNTYLYALSMSLFRGQHRLEITIGLGSKLSYVKQVAMGFHSNCDMTVYLSPELYKNDIPFYIKENGAIKCDSHGEAMRFDEYVFDRIKYKNSASPESYLGHKNIEDLFNYKVRKGDIIIAEKISGKWCISQVEPIRYPTEEVPITELLK